LFGNIRLKAKLSAQRLSHEYVSRVLNVPDGDAPCGDDTPFWFMRQHVVDGIRSGAEMVL
jgi:hypothetical protein